MAGAVGKAVVGNQLEGFKKPLSDLGTQVTNLFDGGEEGKDEGGHSSKSVQQERGRDRNARVLNEAKKDKRKMERRQNLENMRVKYANKRDPNARGNLSSHGARESEGAWNCCTLF